MEQIPSIRARPESAIAFRSIFRAELNKIKAFSNAEIEEMLRAIDSRPGGHHDLRYQKPLFEAYFKGRDWEWPEFTKWSAIFLDLGAWPINWSKDDRGVARAPTSQDADINRHRYHWLMHWVSRRAAIVEMKLRHSTMMSLPTYRIMVTLKVDQPLVDHALRLDSSALPPLFPADYSIPHLVLPEFD
jgi:hypothetical protein